MNEIIKLILLCAIVNYLLRSVPFWVNSEYRKDSYMARVLEFLPITALGALIFPGIITAFPDNPIAGVMGIGAAALVSWIKGGLILPVISSIALAWLFLNF